MPNLLIPVLLVLAVVALSVLRVVVRVRQGRRMRSKPRPDHLNPVVPTLFVVIFVVLFALDATTAVPAARAALIGLGFVSLTASLVGCYFTNRDLHERAGDSWDVNRFTVDRVLAMCCFAVAIVGLALSRVPSGLAGRFGWVSPIVTLALLLGGNLVAWWWRRTHPTPGGPKPNATDSR